MTDERTRAVQNRRRSNAAGPHGHHRPRASEHEFWREFYAEQAETIADVARRTFPFAPTEADPDALAWWGDEAEQTVEHEEGEARDEAEDEGQGVVPRGPGGLP